jgi:cytochrome c
MGRAVGAADGYVRYSAGLKEAAFEWNAAALDGWLEDPAAMIPETYMAFPGIDDAKARADLIAFLEVVGVPDGAERAIGAGLMPATYLRAQAPQPITDAPPYARTTATRHCGDSWFIFSQDGRETPYWEKNIRLKIDSVDSGPPPGVAVLLRAGMRGDRFSVIFSSLADLIAIVEEKC